MNQEKNYMSKYNKHTIVIGTARSGTSWLSENMAKVFRYRMLFEPEHPENTKNGHLITDKLITKENAKNNRQAIEYLKRVFKNQVDSDWIAQHSNRKYKMHLWPYIPKHFIIKFVRGNLMGFFLNQHFNIPVVHVIRNPIDVINSQQRVKFPWLYDLSYFYDQEELNNLIYDKYNINIKEYKEKSEVEILALRWCIENVFLLNHLLPQKSSSYHLIRYEEFKQDVNKYKELCDSLDIQVADNIENKYKQFSSKTHPKSSLRGETNYQNITDQEIKIIHNVLNRFDQSLYIL